ncbi:hypothetical protein DFH06DRAFT_992531 [Mycena polygramma]|nr:hypothetical protein DFH06DRAFT_992531 [Mycena polygramma]
MENVPAVQPDLKPQKIDGLWFPPDVIVIRAGNKMVRVSGGILAARSSVFRDMLALPQPGASDIENIDGFPVVWLHDAAADVEAFLRAIFDSSYFMPAPSPIELSVVLGILRLSHKYDVQYLHRRALKHLAEEGWYPTTYNEDSTDHLVDIAQSSPINALSVIVAAVEVGAQWLLPYAYYCAATFGTHQLLPFLEGQWEPHVRKCLLAHAQLVRGTVTFNTFLTQDPVTCVAPDNCDAVRMASLITTFAQVGRENDLDPLSEWDADRWQKLRKRGICDACYESAKEKHHLDASKFWGKLPAIFGLPPWEELHAMERKAMGGGDDTD